jgi:hypothetical protein
MKTTYAVAALIAILACFDAAAKGSSATAGSSSASSPSQPAAATTSPASSNAPFESVMLAYGAVDQAMSEAASRICNGVDADGSKILIVDQSSLANVVAYDTFIQTAALLARVFDATVSGAQQEEPNKQPATPPFVPQGKLWLGGVFPALNSVNFSTVFGSVAASTNDASAAAQISDVSAELKLINYLTAGPCKSRVIIVSGASYVGKPRLEGVFAALESLARSHANYVSRASSCAASAGPCVALDTTYNQFLQTMWGPNPVTGQPYMAQVLEGYQIANTLDNAVEGTSPLYLVYVNVAAAGTTERVRKNAITFVLTGDWISYSGGAVINVSAVKLTKGKDDSPVVVNNLLTDVLRYRTPLVSDIETPSTCPDCGKADAGNNWKFAAPKAGGNESKP